MWTRRREEKKKSLFLNHRLLCRYFVCCLFYKRPDRWKFHALPLCRERELQLTLSVVSLDTSGHSGIKDTVLNPWKRVAARLPFSGAPHTRDRDKTESPLVQYQLKSGNGTKTETFAMHFLLTVPNPQALHRARAVLMLRSISAKAGGQGRTAVLSARGLFPTRRNFQLGLCERFIPPKNSLRTLQRAGFLGLSPALHQREAPRWGGRSTPFLFRSPTVPTWRIHRWLTLNLQRHRPTK